MAEPVLDLWAATDDDVLRVRRVARDLAGLLDLPAELRTRVGGAVTQLARLVVDEGGGEVVLAVRTDPPPALAVTFAGVPAEALDLAGSPELAGLRRIADRVEVAGHGTPTVRVTWGLDPQAFTPEPAALRAALAERLDPPGEDRVAELRRQNAELVSLLAALREREQAVGALVTELEQQTRDLQAGAAAGERALRALAHELRTPLYATRGMVEAVLADTPGLPTGVRDDLGLVGRAIGEALDLVNDQLDAARSAAGRTRVHLRLVDVHELLGTIRVVAGRLPRTPGVALVVEEAPPLPPLVSDAGKLAQILRNLVTNALKATTRGEVRVTVGAAGDDAVRFAVRDTGLGLSAQDAARVFDEFVQVGGEREERLMRGSGLGLPLARGLAEALGGELTLATRPGAGSEFALRVPLRHPGPGPGVEVVDDR